jgi:histidinol-phosphate/aromatic aminotransferase/cobyric acid decarboxylase-like protein
MGVVAIVCVVVLKIALIASVAGPWRWWVLFLTPLAGRCAFLVHFALLPYVRPEGGLAGIFHRNRSRGHALWALAVLLSVGYVAGCLPGLIAGGCAFLGALLLATYSFRRIGGLTGDPLGPPEWLRPLISSLVSSLIHYPDPDCTDLVQAFSERFGVSADEVLMGNGETDLLYLLPWVLGKGRAVIPVPAYADYGAAAESAGMAVERLPLREEKGFIPDIAEIEPMLRGDEVVFLGRPNNPTGHFLPADAFRELASRHPTTIFVIDEAFADFVTEESLLAKERPGNIVVMRSFTKFYAIPGLRLGAVVGDREIIRRLRAHAPPWSVNTLAQAVGAAALRDVEYAKETRRFVRERREELARELEAIPGFFVYPGMANFLLIRIDHPRLRQLRRPRRAVLPGGRPDGGRKWPSLPFPPESPRRCT